ncbi:hypothetical protein V6N13_113417 [Hibiscus sabdariffa]
MHVGEELGIANEIGEKVDGRNDNVAAFGLIHSNGSGSEERRMDHQPKEMGLNHYDDPAKDETVKKDSTTIAI